MPGLVLVTSRSFGSGRADPAGVLAAAGLRMVHGDPAHDLPALAPQLATATGWLAGAAPIRVDHLDRAPALRVIARYGTGVDGIDLGAARARGVVVTNTPGANAEAVADHTLALILAALRRLVDGDRAVRAGQAARLVGRELASLTVGLVGMGMVGRAVARRLRALGVSVLGTDPAYQPDRLVRLGVGGRSLAELVAGCDVISLHCPGGGPPVLHRGLLGTVRPGAVVVNTARADLIDEVALAELLQTGRVGAAALDVTSGPDSPLRTAPRTVLTPHIAGHTVEAVDRMGMAAAAELVRVLVNGEPPAHPVTGDERPVEDAPAPPYNA
jgi:D-3-phosphoglycerate dehydrogenase / 2-oxoglutarate reductase